MTTRGFANSVPRRLRPSFMISLLITVTVATLGCQTQSPRTTAASDGIAAEVRNADELMVVDCVLPSQVRKLGQRLTYLAPRRAIKTTGTDCEIRGGQYVAYDRANYSTALKIWLPEAKQGNADAMVYVGEIYEKGLGVIADYALARHWYEKAATQGNTRAQINLGYLYESGLGVERDLTTAMNWYRSASGLSEGELEFVSSVELAKREAVKVELGTLREQTQALRERLKTTEAKLSANRRSLASTRQRATRLRNELASNAAAPVAVTTAPDPTTQRELEAAKAEQRRLLAELSDQQQRSNNLNRDLDDSRAALAAERRRLAQMHVELADAQTKLGGDEDQITPAASETAAQNVLRQEIQALTARLETNRDEITRVTMQLAESDTRNRELSLQLAARDREVSDIQRELGANDDAGTEIAQMQASLHASQQERRRLADELARVQLAAAESQNEVAEARQRLDLRKNELESAKSTLAQLSAQLDAQRRGDIAADQSQISALEAAITQREQQLADTSREYAALKQSLAAQSEAAQSQVAQAQQQQQSLRTELQEKDQLIASLNTQLADAVSDNQQLGAVQERLARADAERQRLAAELAQQQLAGSDLQNSLAQAEQSVERGSLQLSELRQASLLLQGQLAERDRDLAAFKARAARLESEVDTRTAALDRQKQEVTRLESQLADERAALDKQLAAARDEQQRLQRLSGNHKAKIEELQRKLSSTQATLAASERKASKLEEVEKELVEKEGQVSAQERELEQLRDRLSQEEPTVDEPAIASVVTTQANGPVIEIIDPPLAATRGAPSILLRTPARKVELIGRVRPEEKLLTFKVNQKTTEVGAQGLFREQVTLQQRETPVNLVAIDELGNRTALDFVVVPSSVRDAAEDKSSRPASKNPGASVDFGNYHALVIGNQAYEHLPDLSTPVNDARELEKVLRNQYGFQTQLLINASRYEILSALNELRAELTDRDNLLVFYAGHGELDNVNLRGHWLPVDAESKSSANWISNIAITDVLNVMNAKHVMVIADSCYSGAMTRSAVARLEGGLSPETKVKWYRTMSKARARSVLTSGGLKPVLDQGGGGHSIFTRALLDTLRQNDQILEGYALFRAVQERVKRSAAQLNVEQDPQYAPIKFAGHEAGEFFFLPNPTRVSRMETDATPRMAAR